MQFYSSIKTAKTESIFINFSHFPALMTETAYFSTGISFYIYYISCNYTTSFVYFCAGSFWFVIFLPCLSHLQWMYVHMYFIHHLQIKQSNYVYNLTENSRNAHCILIYQMPTISKSIRHLRQGTFPLLLLHFLTLMTFFVSHGRFVTVDGL